MVVHQISKAQDKILTIFASLLYLMVIINGYNNYILDNWGYFGFRSNNLGVVDYAYVVTNVLVISFFLPRDVNRASSIIVILLFVSVIAPAQFLVSIHKPENSSEYRLLGVFLSLGFLIPCILTSLQSRGKTALDYSLFCKNKMMLPGGGFVDMVNILNAVACAIMVYKFHSIMRFVAVSDVYDQRRASGLGDATISSIFINYTSSLLTGFFAPAAIANGLSKKSKVSLAIGITSCVVSYMINAAKMVLIMPILMTVFYWLISKYGSKKIKSWCLLLLLSLVFMIAIRFGDKSATLDAIRVHGILRGVVITGFTIPLYHELFSESGYLYWSNLKVFNLFIDPPIEFASDPLWPNLGNIVSARILGVADNNYNANLFAGDGVAAAGNVGLAIVGLALSVTLSGFDRLTRVWSHEFKLLIGFNFGYILVNGHLSTTMLSYGGSIWFCLFYIWNSRAVVAKKVEASLRA